MRWRSIVGWSGMVCLLASAAPAAEVATPEYKVKAAFLYNFAKFCRWPAAAFPTTDSPLVIGVLGEDPFGAALDDLVKDHTIGGRAVMVRRARTVAEVEGAHIVFICRSEAEWLPETLRSLATRKVLTVGDVESFLHDGGMIRMVNERETIRIEICPKAVRRQGLVLSSKLLALARINCPPARPDTKEDR